MKQMNFADAAESQRLRDEAIERVAAAADPNFLDAAMDAIVSVAKHHHELTTDDVWMLLVIRGVQAPPEPRALGAVMRSAQAAEVISPTERHILSSRVACHRRPIRVWKSNIVED